MVDLGVAGWAPGRGGAKWKGLDASPFHFLSSGNRITEEALRLHLPVGYAIKGAGGVQGYRAVRHRRVRDATHLWAMVWGLEVWVMEMWGTEGLERGVSTEARGADLAGDP